MVLPNTKIVLILDIASTVDAVRPRQLQYLLLQAVASSDKK